MNKIRTKSQVWKEEKLLYKWILTIMELAIIKFRVLVFFTAAKGLPAKLANKAWIIGAIIPQLPVFQFYIVPSGSNDSHASEKTIRPHSPAAIIIFCYRFCAFGQLSNSGISVFISGMILHPT